MIISNFAKNDISKCLENCNFTDTERDIFLMRSKGKSLIECSMKLNISYDNEKHISAKINRKIMTALS